ncbi:MAG: hypothetical protein ACRDO1_15100 [Nocardioidaceae bacterium]
MAGFVQIVEAKTSRMDEVRALGEEMQAAPNEGSTVRRATITTDRDRPGYFLSIIEFDSYESAMQNSDHPETQKFAARLAELCDGPPTFYNLDVTETWTL